MSTDFFQLQSNTDTLLLFFCRWWMKMYVLLGAVWCLSQYYLPLFLQFNTNWLLTIIKQVYRRRYVSRRSSKPELYLKIKQKQKIWRKTIFNMADGIITPCNVARSWHWYHQVTAPYNVACSSEIMTVNSPSGSTLLCDTWLWDDMPLNSPKRPPYWNSTSAFEFHHITAVDMSFCTSLRNFIQIGPPSAEKNT